MNKGYNIPCEFVSISPNDEWTKKLGKKILGKIILKVTLVLQKCFDILCSPFFIVKLLLTKLKYKPKNKQLGTLIFSINIRFFASDRIL